MFRCLPVCKHLCIYQTVDEEELQDVQKHSPQRDLQWPQMRVGCEQRDEAQGTENVRNGKHCFSYKRWMPHLPLVPGFTTTVLNRTMDGEHIKWEHRKVTLQGSILLLFKDNKLPWRRPQSWVKWWPSIESSWQSPSGSTSHGYSLGNHHPTFVWSLPRWILEKDNVNMLMFNIY